MKINIELDQEDVMRAMAGFSQFLESLVKQNTELIKIRAEKESDAGKDALTIASEFMKKHEDAAGLLIDLGAQQQELKHHKPYKNKVKDGKTNV